jgi:ketose-bisphosphate aldolase
MLVNLKDLLKRAYKKKVALGAFNAYNLETIRGIIKAAEGLNAPVIVETTPKAIEYAGLKYLSTLIREMADDASIPVVLHLDHGLSIEIVEQAIEAGYTSVMIDGSHLPLFENIALTKKAVEIAHKKGIPVEGELGTVTEHLRFTNPEEVPEFVRKTGVDSLAVAIGSSHGHAPKEELDLELLSRIRRKTDIPLVLHGASGVSDPDIKGAIQRGIAKINIDTNLREVFTASIRENIKDPQIIDPRQYLKAAEDAIAKLVEEKILLFGSMNV